MANLLGTIVTKTGTHEIYETPGAQIIIDDQASPTLANMARIAPEAFRRALGHVGSKVIRARLREAAAKGYRGIPPLSEMQQSRAMDRLIRRGAKSVGSRHERWSRFRPAQKRVSRLFGRLASAVGFWMPEDKSRFEVKSGWIGASAARWFENVASGAWGGYRMRAGVHTGDQPITKQMRAAFAAVGILISRHRRTIQHPIRDLVAAVFADLQREVPDILIERMNLYLSRGLAG